MMKFVVTDEQLTDIKEYYATDDVKKFHKTIEEIFNTPFTEEATIIRKYEQEAVLNEVVEELTNAIDDKTRTFKGLHAAIAIVEKIRKKKKR